MRTTIWDRNEVLADTSLTLTTSGQVTCGGALGSHQARNCAQNPNITHAAHRQNLELTSVETANDGGKKNSPTPSSMCLLGTVLSIHSP